MHKYLERIRQAVGSFVDIAWDDNRPYYLHDIFDKSDRTVGRTGGDGYFICVRLCRFDERVLC